MKSLVGHCALNFVLLKYRNIPKQMRAGIPMSYDNITVISWLIITVRSTCCVFHVYERHYSTHVLRRRVGWKRFLQHRRLLARRPPGEHSAAVLQHPSHWLHQSHTQMCSVSVLLAFLSWTLYIRTNSHTDHSIDGNWSSFFYRQMPFRHKAGCQLAFSRER